MVGIFGRVWIVAVVVAVVVVVVRQWRKKRVCQREIGPRGSLKIEKWFWSLAEAFGAFLWRYYHFGLWS